MKLLLSVFVATAVTISLALDCSQVITKEQQGVLSWLGMINITVPVSTGESGWAMTLFFSQNFTGVGVWEGFVEYNRDEKWAEIVNRDETDAELNAGDEKALRFRINYGLDIPIPEVVSFRFQDIEMCR